MAVADGDVVTGKGDNEEIGPLISCKNVERMLLSMLLYAITPPRLEQISNDTQYYAI